MKKHILALLLFPILFGCATVRDHRNMLQPTNQLLTASVGSTIFRMNKSGDLPNVFGGRDIFGGKVDKGFTELKLIKIEDRRFIHLLAHDIDIQSTETTMDRYSKKPSVDVNQSIKIGAGDSGGILVVIDFNEEEQIYSLSGIEVKFIEVRDSSVDYILRDTFK